MSVAAINWALRQRTGSPARKAILFTLANYANVEGVSFPSRARLAEECDMSKDAVDDNLKDLIAAGFVTKVTGRRQGRYQGTNEYRLNLDLEALENHLSRNRLVPVTERQEAALSESGPQGGSETPTERLEPPPQGGPQGGSGAAQTLEPLEPRGTSARQRARDPQDDLFDRWWEAYPQQRQGARRLASPKPRGPSPRPLAGRSDHQQTHEPRQAEGALVLAAGPHLRDHGREGAGEAAAEGGRLLRPAAHAAVGGLGAAHGQAALRPPRRARQDAPRPEPDLV